MKVKLTSEYFKESLKQLDGFSLTKKTIICVSGGIDSMALLHLSKQALKNIIAVTVDHNTRKNSAKEAKFVADYCKRNKIIHHSLLNENPLPNSNIEENLRLVRYQLITDFAKKNKITQALLAHHLDDNIETFFMRLERGSGLKGLASMRKQNTLNNINFYRPFLDISKQALRDYLTENKIKNIEDETNKNLKLTRNNIRNFLENMSGYDIFSERVGSAIKHLQDAEDLINNIEQKTKDAIVKLNKNNAEIELKGFLNADKQIALRILKTILIQISPKNKIPRYENLQLLYSNLGAKAFKRQTLNGCIINIKSNKIIVSKEL